MKQYAVFFDGMWIEMTGYLDSLAKAREFLKQRYSSTEGMTIKVSYPPSAVDGIEYTV